MSDDILDDTSLSDDDLLDSLADDMLMEMAEGGVTHQPASISTPTTPPAWPLNTRSTPSAVALPATMPDLSQMMSQMMPMMSQMFGGRGSTSLQQAPVSWQELVKHHVPSHEQEDWLTTIDKDATKLRVASASGMLKKPYSRSYRTKNTSPLPHVYMEVTTMLTAMLSEAVRSAELEHHPKWQTLKQDMVVQLQKTGMMDVFEDKFKEMLRQRVVNDVDFVAEKTSGRYGNITDALAVV